MPALAFLRRVLALDALSCLLLGILLVVAAPALSPLLGLSQPLLLWAGGLLIPAGAFIGWLWRQPSPIGPGLWLVIVGNLIWVAKSLAVIGVADRITGLGIAFVAAQAGTVLLLAALEYHGMRRLAAA